MALDLNGAVFGYLTVVGPAPQPEGNRYRHWSLRCICGAIVVRCVQQLHAPRKSEKQSCGCRKHELMADARRTHGLSKRPLYSIWNGIRDRCENPKNQDWSRYGGRGIALCDRWQSYTNFEADMLDGYRPGLSVERTDNNSGYSPGNCVWATQLEQMQNTRRNVLVETPKGAMTLSTAARTFGINAVTLHQRHHKGWSGEKLVSPVRSRPPVPNRDLFR
jgi:hypothetical protein